MTYILTELGYPFYCIYKSIEEWYTGTENPGAIAARKTFGE